MAIKALMLDETVEYVSKYDKASDPKDQTIWVLGVLDSSLLASIEDDQLEFELEEGDKETAAKTTTKMKINQRNMEVLRQGLKDVKNFVDGNGAKVPFQKTSRPVAGRNVTLVDDGFIKRVPYPIVKELAERILDINKLTEAEVKNSD